MEALTKLALAAVDLAEAELKSLQRGTLRLAMAIAMVIGGGIFALAGVWMLLWAGYKLLVRVMGDDIPALAIVGVVFAALGAILALMAWKRVTGREHPTQAGPRQPSNVTAEKLAEEAAAQKRENEQAFKEGRPPEKVRVTAEGAPDEAAPIRIAS